MQKPMLLVCGRHTEMENSAGTRLRKGAWTTEEDMLLRDCVQKYGEGKWHLVPLRAGLNRCRKSCRLRWLNYLRPNIKRGYFGDDEVDLIVRLHKLLGNRWSLIAGRLPGRTANDVKNFWNTHISKKQPSTVGETDRQKIITRSNIVRPRPRTFSNSQTPAWSRSKSPDPLVIQHASQLPSSSAALSVDDINQNASLHEDLDECINQWWGNLLHMAENGQETPFWFSDPDDDSQIARDESTSHERYGANHDGTCGCLSIYADDLELEQY